MVEGIVLAGYRYRPSPGTPEPLLEDVTLVGQEQPAAAGAHMGKVMAEASLRARRWADEPARKLSPRTFAEAAAEAGVAAGLEVEIWDEERVTRPVHLGCLGQRGRGIGRTSPSGPGHVRAGWSSWLSRVRREGHYLRLRWLVAEITRCHGDDERRHGWRGCSSGGGYGIRRALAPPSAGRRLGCHCGEHAWRPCRCRPGDVVTARDGTAVEVVNTDAEGRACAGGRPSRRRGTASRCHRRYCDPDRWPGDRPGAGVAAVLGTDELVERVDMAGAAAVK